jgi:hypothetical protein
MNTASPVFSIRNGEKHIIFPADSESRILHFRNRGNGWQGVEAIAQVSNSATPLDVDSDMGADLDRLFAKHAA